MEIHTRCDGDIITHFKYCDNFFSEENYHIIFNWLNCLPFIKGERFNGSKIDREQIWFQNDGRYFCEAWKTRKDRWQPYYYDDQLTCIQNKIIGEMDVDINSCLVNKYYNGDDIISPHKDNSYSFGEYPTVLIYSVGSERSLRLTSDIDKSIIDFTLKPNSLFIMSGGSQKYFTHEIIKSTTEEVRYSLTFRNYII